MTLTTNIEEKLKQVESLIVAERHQEAGNLLAVLVSNYPDNFQANFLAGYLCSIGNQIEVSKNFALKSLAIGSNKEQDNFNLGILFNNLGMDNQSLISMLKTIEINPRNRDALLNIAHFYSKKHLVIETLKYLKLAFEIQEDANTCDRIANLLIEVKELDEAQKYYNILEKLDPSDKRREVGLGIIERYKGNTKKALEIFENSFKSGYSSTLLLYHIAFTKKFKTKEEAQPYFEAAYELEKKAKNNDELIFLYSAIGHIYDVLENHDMCFEYKKKSNDLMRTDEDTAVSEELIEIIEKNIKIFKRVFNNKTISYGSDSKQPVFILGMPRSGTSLTEQVLSNHSKVHCLGESKEIYNTLYQFDFNKISKREGKSFLPPEYVEYLNHDEIKQLSETYLNNTYISTDDSIRVTNKMPFNFVYIGFINLMFPNAKIIHCRRHPLDIILSMYFQNFNEIKYAHDLHELSAVYKSYNNAMKEWKKTLPIKILDVFYRDMTENTEKVIREIIDFCDLEWEQKCLDFHKSKRPVFTASDAQVRRPIYKTSTFKWLKYEHHLEDVKKILSAEIAEYEAELRQKVDF